MKVGVRQKKLLGIFMDSTEFLTVSSLAETLHVSQRTIHSDLSALENQGNIFEKKPGVGIRLKEAEQGKTEDKKNPYTPEYRRNYILKLLLFDGVTITYQSMAEQFLVSVSSILADLNYIKTNILHDQTLNLVGDGNGTRFEGEEVEWNKTLISFNEHLKKTSNLKFTDEKYKELLSMFYTKEVVQACYQLVRDFEFYDIEYVAEYYLENVFHALLALVFRVKKGCHHSIPDTEVRSEAVLAMMDCAGFQKLIKSIEKNADVSFQDEDIYLLSLLLKANRISFKEAGVEYASKVSVDIHDMIEQISNSVHVDFGQDEELYNNLYHHIVPMIQRLQHGMVLRNPMLDEIKAEYRMMYELTWLTVDMFIQKMGLKITEDEVGYLTLYFQSALEKQKKIKKILVVCPNGVVTSTLIANRIRSYLPPIDIIEIASKEDLAKFDYSHIDFIVSTVPLDVKDKKVVIVSTILTSKDLEKIESVYKGKLQKPQPEENKTNTLELMEYLNPEHVFFHQGKMDKKTVIHQVCDRLFKDGMVDEKFENSILEREKKGATDNVFGGAIPHAEVSTVKKTCLALWVNSEPIKWTKYKAKVIVFLAIAEQDSKKMKLVLEKGFSFIKSKEIVDVLSSCTTREELLTQIYGGINFD